MSLLTGLVVGFYPPWPGTAAPAAASTPTGVPSAVAERTGQTADPQQVVTDPGTKDAVVPDAASTVFVPADERRTITIAGVGDILLHKEIVEQAVADGGGSPDFTAQLEGITPLIEAADLAVCHMEFPLGSREGPWTAWPDVPNGPPQITEAVAAMGFDACSTASNHTLDQGFDGVVSTINALESAGLAHAGSASSESAAADITMIDVRGVPVALLSYTYGFNGIPRPYDWCCNLIEPDAIVADAQRARDGGARLVVVSLHHGEEGVSPPTESQRDVVQQLADSGTIDLVLGHHAHVVQPVTKVGSMWVAYGHGNLLSAQSRRDPRSGDGLLTTFTFAEQADGSFLATSAVGYAIVNYDFPFSIAPVPSYAEPGDKADATWTRVSEQALIPGDTSGFELRRVDW